MQAQHSAPQRLLNSVNRLSRSASKLSKRHRNSTPKERVITLILYLTAVPLGLALLSVGDIASLRRRVNPPGL
jgi:hypothetical protein